jgi:hypothetical protein
MAGVLVVDAIFLLMVMIRDGEMSKVASLFIWFLP